MKRVEGKERKKYKSQLECRERKKLREIMKREKICQNDENRIMRLRRMREEEGKTGMKIK